MINKERDTKELARTVETFETLSMKIQVTALNVAIMSDISCRYTSLPGTFSYKVTTDIDYFTGEPIVQCDVPVVKKT